MSCHNESVSIVETKPTLTQAVIAILRAAIRQKNGAVTDAMTQMGSSYALNYGVSVITLKDICQPYTQHAERHDLAAALWRQGVRELRLAALFIEDPTLVTTQQAILWSRSWESVEMAEQSALRMMSQSPDALPIAEALLTDLQNPLQVVAAYHIIARACTRFTDTQIRSLLKFFGPQTEHRAAVVALREVWIHHPAVRSTINEIPINDELRSELAWQIEE